MRKSCSRYLVIRKDKNKGRKLALFQSKAVKSLSHLTSVLILTALAVSSCVSPETDGLIDGAISMATIKAHIQKLSNDSIQTSGTKKNIAKYIESQFRSAGLKPAVGGSSYFQTVPLTGITSTTSLFFRGSGHFWKMAAGVDFAGWSQLPQKNILLRNKPVIFLGFGIDAPEYNWSDYKNIDVSGKILMILVDEPQSTDTTFFNGKEPTYYGRCTYKFAEAARKGAVAVFLIRSLPNKSTQETFVLKNLDNHPGLKFQGFISVEKTTELFNGVGLNLDRLISKAYSSGFIPVELPLFATVSVQNETRYLSVQNIIGKVCGSRSDSDGECLIYTSLYEDSERVGAETNGRALNEIFNPASGTAILLEIARAMANSPVQPERTIVFAAIAAKKNGLPGSEYLIKHPAVPVSRIIAAINVAVPEVLGETLKFRSYGFSPASFRGVFSDIRKLLPLKIIHNPTTIQNLYLRPDQNNFINAGISTVFFTESYRTEKGIYPEFKLHSTTKLATALFKAGLRMANEKAKNGLVQKNRFNN